MVTKDGQPIDMAEVAQVGLDKKKNDEQHEEQGRLRRCQRWCIKFAHSSTAGRIRENTVYHCPFCVKATRVKLKQDKPTTKHKSAKDIDHTQCSTYIETRVRQKLKNEVLRIADSEFEGDKSKVEVPGTLHVRQLSNLKDKMHRVKPRMLEKYKEDAMA